MQGNLFLVGWGPSTTHLVWPVRWPFSEMSEWPLDMLERVVSCESCECTGLRGLGRKMPSLASWSSAEVAILFSRCLSGPRGCALRKTVLRGSK